MTAPGARPRTLLLAWGNPGRRDDGLGPALAERAESLDLPGLTVSCGYQLQVEDAAEVARHDRVVFVDADRAGPAPFHLERLLPADRGSSFSSHSVAPEAVLALARDLFGSEPEAWLLGIRGEDFDGFGEGLSDSARAHLHAALRCVCNAVRADAWPEPDADGNQKDYDHEGATCPTRNP